MRKKTAEPGTRDRILQAAAKLMRMEGLARTTTRMIAREAGVADGAVFYHFKDRLDLFLQMLLSSAPDLRDSVMQLMLLVGKETVEANLAALIEKTFPFHLVVAPIVSSLMAEPELMVRYREALQARNAGPHRLQAAIAAYLEAEQRLGRVDARVDPAAFAALLISSSFQHAHDAVFFGRPERAPAKWARSVVKALVNGIAPRPD